MCGGVPATETDLDKKLLSFQPQIITHLLKNLKTPLSWVMIKSSAIINKVRNTNNLVLSCELSSQSQLSSKMEVYNNNTSPLNL